MGKLRKLADDYKITKNEMDELYQEMYEIMNLEVTINNRKHYVISFDIESESMILCDKNSGVGSNNRYEVSFDDFEILLKHYK